MKDQSSASVNTAFNKADQEHAGIIKAHRATTGLDILAQAADQVGGEDSISVSLPYYNILSNCPKWI